MKTKKKRGKTVPLVPLRPLLEATVKYGFGQGAFNINAVAQAKVAIEVHGIFRSAAILQGADLTNGFMGGQADFMNVTLADKKIGARNMTDAVRKYGVDSEVPIILHLGHGWDYDSCVAAIEGGYTPVMIDDSSLPFEENIELMREVTKYTHARGISVEEELSVLAGTEDHVFSASPTCTNPLDMVEFSKQAGVDALAISYGTIHGASKGKDVKLRKEVAIAIHECMNHAGIFSTLVSRDSSTIPKYIVDETSTMDDELTNTYGISIEEPKTVIPVGISKINVDTDIRLTVTKNMKELFAKYPEKRASASIGPIYELLEIKKSQLDPRVFLPPIMDAVMYRNVPDEDVTTIVSCVERDMKEVVGTLIVESGSSGKAPLVEQISLDGMAERYERMER